YTCHKPKVTKKPERTCENMACHARDNKHKDRFVKEFPSCGSCHDAVRWKPDSVFAHDTQTKFKLTGKHALATCRACHRGKEPWQFERFAPAIQCMQCHKHENVHERKFTNAQCLGCHRMSGVKQAKGSAESRFHGPKSTFPLDGGHVSVPCIDCHPK